jgi:hypothetical protein
VHNVEIRPHKPFKSPNIPSMSTCQRRDVGVINRGNLKPRFPNQSNRAFARIELLMVIVGLGAVVLLAVLAAAKQRATNLNCVSNLRAVYMTMDIWTKDNHNQCNFR